MTFSLVPEQRIVGIVGAEAAKFTAEGEALAKDLIRGIITGADEVVSGGCHLGGIDIWAEEIAAEMGRKTTIFKPARLSWNDGYKPRNLKIAGRSQIVHNIVVDCYPPDYRGMRFDYCYHCNRKDHIKSGGCWTMYQARAWVLHIIKQ